ncbi:MAG: hypothetical protein ACRC6I_21465 [Paracoccaceae bacterium]
MRCCLAIALWLGLSCAGPTFAQERLSLDEAREFASELLMQNQPAAAREIALGLLQADANDIGALLLLSRAERALGNTDAAVGAGRAAWRASQTDAEKFISASAIAQAHAAAENYGRAQNWLRRAVEAAPTPEYAALAAQDYALVRQENPLSVQLAFGALPTDNVNNGNSNDTITFAYLPGALANIAFEVPADDRPVSGLLLTGQVQLSYRLARTPTSQTAIGLGIFGQTYVISESGKARAPDVTSASLTYQQASVSLTHTWLPAASTNPYSLDLSYAQSSYGGDPYTRDLGLTLGRQWRVDEADRYAVSAAFTRTTYLADGSDADALNLRGAWNRTLANDDVFGLSFSANRVFSDRPDRGYDALGAQISYNFGEVAPWVDLSVSASLEKRVYDVSSYDPAGRSDLRSALQINVGLPELDFYGFEPVATVSANRTNSSVPYFETESIRMGIQIRSSF